MSVVSDPGPQRACLARRASHSGGKLSGVRSVLVLFRFVVQGSRSSCRHRRVCCEIDKLKAFMSPVILQYGQQGVLTLPVGVSAQWQVLSGPAAVADAPWAIRQALQHPLEFPPFQRSVVPGDQIVIVLDRQTPCGELLIAELWTALQQVGVMPGDVLILQPTTIGGLPLVDPRELLPEGVRSQIRWETHDATDPEQLAYLANTLSGERIYLNRAVVLADLVLTVGEVAFDPILGFRGTCSSLYPGLSSAEAIKKSRGFGHQELSPQEERPLRQIQEEVSWLLGAQFSLQVLAGPGNTIAQVWAGLEQEVYRTAQARLNASRSLRISERVELVVLAVESDAAGQGWQQFGAALASARNIVQKGGKIVLLTEFEQTRESLSEGLEIVRRATTPREALRPLRDHVPVDFLAASYLAQAADWAEVYFLGAIPSDLAEELFLHILASPKEAQRLIEQSESVVILAGAQHVDARLEHPSAATT